MKARPSHPVIKAKSDEPKLGHDYMPNWISVAFNVEQIRNGRVYGTFYTGHRRNFALEGFMDSFTHDEDCILCQPTW